MLRFFFTLLLGMITLFVLAACNTSEKSDTANEAVTLMQDVEDNSLRAALYDAVEALNAQEGYAARLTLDHASSSNDPSSALQLTMQVDPTQTMLAEIQHSLVTRRYTVIATDTPNITRTIVRLDTPDPCIASETSADPDTAADAWLLNNGLDSIMAEVASALDAEQILAIINTPKDKPDTLLLGRKTQPYTVEARLNEAHAIAREVASNATPSIPRIVEFTFTGMLYLDSETAALLQFDAQYDQPGTGRTAQASFMVTQWGGIDPIAIPTDLASLEHCP